MDPTMLPDLSKVVPLQVQLYFFMALAVFSMLGKILGALRTGGGLRRILLGAWYGDSIPPVVAKDYKTEISNVKPNDTQIQ